MTEEKIISCEIVDLSHDGRGVGRIDGKACFVQGALPEETIEFRYTNRKRNYDEARVTKVVQSSPARVDPVASIFLAAAAAACNTWITGSRLSLNSNSYWTV